MESFSSDYPRSDPKRFTERTTGRKITEAVACVILCLFLAAIFWPVYSSSGPPNKRTHCLSNIKQITLGLIMYSDDYDGHLPDSGHWMDRLGPYTRNETILHDTLAEIRPPDCGYAFRSSASRLNMGTLKAPETFALDFDSDLLERNASSDLLTLPRPGRHGGQDSIGYADGHAKSVKIARQLGPTTAGD